MYVTMNVFIDLTNLSLVPNSLQWLSNLLLTAFYGFVVLIMLNLLIAIINNTYAVWSLCDESIFLIEKCNIMDFFDKHLDSRQIIDEREKYCSIRRKVAEKSESESDKTEASKVYTMELKEIELDWDTAKTDSFLSTRLQKTSLFIIDPQVDFHPGGSLAVPGADEDSERIANMIKKNKQFIHEIFVSMDSHYPTHIAHAIFWVNDKGEHPEPFTVIRYVDVRKGVWVPKENSTEVMDWCKKYIKALERKGRMKLTIWPPHCIIGSRGHCIVPAINEALQEWAAFSHRPVTYVLKGQNCRTEMYSALEAEVVDPWDSTTALNSDLVSMLRVAERVRIVYFLLTHYGG
jgi:nicotinamidase-related amidase